MLLPLLLALPLTTRPIAPLDDVVACVRVGDAAGALERLSHLHPEGDDQPVATLLRAQALTQLERRREALEALDAYRINARAVLDPVAAEVALDLAWARPVWDPARFGLVVQAAEAVLAYKELPEASRWEARLRHAAMLRVLPARLGEAEAELRAIATQTEVQSLKAPALELLAEGGSKSADERLLIDFGATAEGHRALKRLAPATLSSAARLSRARHLFADRDYVLAEADYIAAVADGRLSGEQHQEAELTLAIIALRLHERTDDAIAGLDRAARGPDRAKTAEAVYRKGIALGRLERWEPARAAMRRYLKLEPKGPFALNAGYQVGRLAHQAGRYVEAARDHEQFLKKKKPDHAKWLWFEGFAWFRANKQAAARKVFDQLAPDTNLLVGAKALYWIARSFQAEGKKADARKTLERLLARAPYSYYGLLGDVLLHTLDPKHPLGPTRPADLPLPVVLPDLDPWIKRLEDLPAGGRLKAAKLLLAVGRPDYARIHLSGITEDSSIKGRLGPAHDAFARTVDHARERVGARWRQEARRRLPWDEGLFKADRDLLRATYPLAWVTLAEAAGRLHGVSRWWLLAHMLQESRFKAEAISGAGALGAMQVLPRTGRRIAARTGFPPGDFFAERLFEPGVALRHAAWYLGALRVDFGGNLLLAIAAYNGGPLRFAEHLRAHKDLPFDLLIEEIGAHESRNYVRKVTDHLVRFSTLYATDAERAELLEAMRPPEHLPQARGEVRF